MYNILMSNPAKPKTQEWLNNPAERTKRFGDLGLSSNQNYSGLTKEEKHFLNLNQEERDYIHSSATVINHKYNNDKREYIRQFMEIYDDLSSAFTSPDKSQTRRLNLSLTDAILSLNIPVEEIQKIAGIMAEDDTPFFVKQMATFKVQHPIDRLSNEFSSSGFLGRQTMSTGDGADGRHIQSTVLRRTLSKQITTDEEGKMYNAEMIIYRDLLKCAFESGGKNIERFLSKLSGGEFMMRAIMCWPDSNEPIGRYYSKKDLDDFQALIGQLHSMYYQTEEGKKESYDTSLHNRFYDYGGRSIKGVKSEIQKIYEEYRPDRNRTLTDQVIQKLCSPLGIKSMAEAYNYLEDSKSYSWFRHQEIIKTGKAGSIRKGDLVKSIVSSDYLPYILETGVLSREYLGTGEASDCTPLDTDVSMILNHPHNLRAALSETSASSFSGINYPNSDWDSVFLVFWNDKRFERINENATSFNKDKYEICGHPGGKILRNGNLDEFEDGYWYEDDYGIRTGIPSSEIDYIATDEKSAKKVIDAVRQSGLYIPVTDLDGNLIFNPFKL